VVIASVEIFVAPMAGNSIHLTSFHAATLDELAIRNDEPR
jgi:hypothetical protein